MLCSRVSCWRPSHPGLFAQVITGFLGSGKTTLLNYILTQQHGKRIAGELECGGCRSRRMHDAHLQPHHLRASAFLFGPCRLSFDGDFMHACTAVIENEFGEIDIDSELVARTEVRHVVAWERDQQQLAGCSAACAQASIHQIPGSAAARYKAV